MINKLSDKTNKIELVSEYESKAQQWIPLMGGSVPNLLKKIIQQVQQISDDPALIARVVFGMSRGKELSYLEKFPRAQLFRLIKSFRGYHGLVGEIILETLGIGSKVAPLPGITSFIKQKLKLWITSSIDLQKALT